MEFIENSFVFFQYEKVVKSGNVCNFSSSSSSSGCAYEKKNYKGDEINKLANFIMRE